MEDRWRSVYGTEPPPRNSRKLLVAAVAYRMQERAFGPHAREADSSRAEPFTNCSRTRSYIGEIRHKKVLHPGQHEAIMDRQTWEEVQRRLRDQTARDGIPKIKALYATGAKGRHGGRYRYYISRELVRGGGSSLEAEKGWRLAAPELEQSVLVSARSILNDQTGIATMLQEAGVSSAEIHSVLKAAEAKSALLESGPEAAPTIAELVKRVDLRKNGIEISMNLESLAPPNSAVRRAPSLTFTRLVALQMKRRGVAMRLVIGGGVSTRKIDPTLLKASPADTSGSTNSSRVGRCSLGRSRRERG